jgi:hypothetical protein
MRTILEARARALVCLIAILVLITACGPSSPALQPAPPGSNPTAPPAPAPATRLPEAPPTAQPPPVASPATIPDAAGAGALPAMPGPGSTWHVLLLGDNQLKGTGDNHKVLLGDRLGVGVEVDDLSKTNLSTGDLLKDLRSFAVVRTAVKKADVIFFAANPMDQIGGAIENGLFGDGERYDCSADALARYRSGLGEIIDEILVLREGMPTIVRTMDFAENPAKAEKWRQEGRLDEYHRCWTEINRTIHEAAAARGIPVAEVHTAINGPSGDRDLVAAGLVEAFDGRLTGKGGEAVAGAFAATGYAPVVPGPDGATPAPAAMPPTVSPDSTAVWDLVVLGDSESWGMGEHYARFIEEDLGVKVRLHDMWRGGLTTSQLLSDLRTFDIVRKAVAGAEVVTAIANPADFIGWKIVGDSAGSYDCSEKAMAGYRADLEAIFAEVLALRQGRPTALRTMDFYTPTYSLWKKDGTYEEYRRCWIAQSEAIHQAAATHGIPVAEVYAAFNGPGFDQDPRDAGLIGTDGEHPSEAGRAAVAQAFRATGYAPLGR